MSAMAAWFSRFSGCVHRPRCASERVWALSVKMVMRMAMLEIKSHTPLMYSRQVEASWRDILGLFFFLCL